MTTPASEPSAFLLRTLGTAELHELDRAGQPLPRLLGPGKPLALLAYCCCARDREHSRDFLAALLWSDADTARSRQSLRQALWRLRKLVGEHLRTRDDAVLGVDPAVETDRDRFLAAIHRGDAAAALQVYGGPFLPGLTAPGGDEFEDWAALERRQLEEALVRIVENHARGLLSNGKRSQAREAVNRLMALAPGSLDAHRIGVDVLLEAGDRVDARRAADVLESLARSLGGRAPSLVESLVTRARDADEPRSDDPAPTLVLDLVGREGVFGAVMAAWQRARDGESQVVVLSGVPGVGKSRLLAAIAQRCATRRTLAVTVRANPGEREVPFGFASAIVRTLAALPGAAGVSGDSARELVALDPGLGSQFATTPSLDDGGESVRRRALAVLDLLTAIGEQSPLALCLDDLHWADAATRQLLAIVLGRVTDVPLLVVATTRGSSATIFDQRVVSVLPLLPLDHDEVVDAIRSSGTWPETPDATRFIQTLASVCEGIPLSVMERLSLVRERGLLALHRGTWESPDWTAAANEIAVASPLDHRLAACADTERAVLLALAVAGTPLSESIMARAATALVPVPRVTPTNRPRVIDLPPALAALELLEVKGLVVRTGESWVPNHDVVAERTLALATPDERQACHLALAAAFASTLGDPPEPEGMARAVRHYLLGGDDARAGTQFARVVARARALGDRRPVRELLAELVGERLPEPRLKSVLRRVPVWHRVARLRTRVAVAAMAVMAGVSVVTSVMLWRRPVLMVTQSATTSALSYGNMFTANATTAFGPQVRNTTPSIIVSVGSDTAGRTRPVFARVRALSRGTRIVSGDSAPVVDGYASFNRLRFISSDSVSVFRFEAAGFRAVDVPVRRLELEVTATSLPSRLRLAGGVLHGRPIDPRAPVVEVTAGDSLTGVVELEYTSPLVAASVWLSMTPTWGDPRQEAHEIAPLLTPVQRELLSVPVRARAPSQPGHYWLLYLMAAEPSGMFGLSRTNWTVERAVWGDGNDLASLPDSTIRSANANGFTSTYVAYPADYTMANECRPVAARLSPVPIKHCRYEATMAGIEVIVR